VWCYWCAHTHRKDLSKVRAQTVCINILWGKYLSDTLAVPILRQLIPDGIDYGMGLLFEFEPDSIWYETSLTIAAQALREGAKTAYHTFRHAPCDIERWFAQLGLDGKKLKNDGLFELIDSYSAQIGLTQPEKLQNVTTDYAVIESLKLPDLSISYSQAMKSGVPDKEKRWLHIDDDTTVMTKYNSENAIIEFLRTRANPMAQATGEITLIALLKGVASDSFYRQREALSDGIIELKTEEEKGEIEQRLRVRLMRGKKFDSKWHTLKLQDNGEVTLE